MVLEASTSPFDPWEALIADIRMLISISWSWQLFHVLREGNSGAADMLWPSFT